MNKALEAAEDGSKWCLERLIGAVMSKIGTRDEKYWAENRCGKGQEWEVGLYQVRFWS